jgi:hypothetical protein
MGVLHVVNDNGSHFINDIIEILTIEFMITHHTSLHIILKVMDKSNPPTKSLNDLLSSW